MIYKLCNVNNLTQVEDRHQCHGLQIYPPEKFYPLFGSEFHKFYEPKDTKYVLNITENSMGFHFGNNISKDENVKIGNGAAYDLIAKKHCPRIYAEHKSYF